MSSPEMLQEKAGSPMEPAHVNPELRPDVSSQRPEKYLGPTKTRETVLIPIDDLMDPPWNPRDIEDEGEMDKLTAFMAAGGDIPPITVLKGEGGAPWNVISGKRRRKAARILGWTQMEVLYMDISLEEAMAQAIASNRDSKPFWLDEAIAIANLKAQTNWRLSILAPKVGYPLGVVSERLSLSEVLNKEARNRIKQGLKAKNDPKNTAKNFAVRKFLEQLPEDGVAEVPKDEPKTKIWRLNESAALPLTWFLKDRVKEAAQALALKALDPILAGQYTGAQVEGLVQHMIGGKDLAEFQPPAKGNKGRPSGSGRKAQTDLKAETLRTPNQTEVTSNTPRPAPTEAPLAAAELEVKTTQTGQGRGDLAEAPATPSAGKHPGQVTQPATPSPEASPKETNGTFQDLFWKEAAGISMVSQIRAKLKKGEKPTLGEQFVLTINFTINVVLWAWKHVLRPILKFTWGIAKKVIHWALRLVRDLAKALGGGIKAILRVVLYVVGVILIIAVLGWSAVEVWKHGFHLAPILHDFMELVWGWTRLLWRWV